jgi:CBS domain-containing protein
MAAVELHDKAKLIAPIARILSEVTVGEMLDAKPNQTLYEVEQTDRVIKAVETMVYKDIGCVMVRGSGSTHVGMITKEDIMRKMVLRGRLARDTNVTDVMKPRLICATRDFTLTECIEIMRAGATPIRYMPVVADMGDPNDEDTRVIGILSEREVMAWFVRSFLDAVDTDPFKGYASLKDVCNMEANAPDCFVQENDTVYEALQAMKNLKATGAIVNSGPKAVGIMTGTDYLKGIILPKRSSKNVAVKEIMKTNVVAAPPHYSLLDCMNLMLQYNVHHLPVGDWIVGSEGKDLNIGGVLFDTQKLKPLFFRYTRVKKLIFD